MSSYLARLWNNSAATAVRSVVDRRIIETASALYGAQMVNQLLPMMLIPYLARVLGPDNWGIVLFVQAIGTYLLLVVEYSFNLSATREVARNREDRNTLAQIVAGVIGARITLAVGCIAAVGIGQLLFSTLQDLGILLWLGVFWFIAMAMRPFWFFLGLERVRTILTLEVSLKLVAVASIFVFVSAPGDAWMVFAFQGIASTIATVASIGIVYRMVGFRRPTIAETLGTLKRGWNLFVFSASTSIYGMSDALLLGFVATPAAVAYYGAGERIIRLLYNGLSPITSAMFPRVTTLVKDDPNAAARMARITTLTLFALASTGAVVLYFLAPFVIRVALGPGYSEAVPVLRILLIVLVINSISIPLGNHWMVPSGLDGMLTKVTIAGGIFHLPVALFLGSQFAHIGIAWALVITEVGILTVLMTLLVARGLGPFRMRLSQEPAQAESRS